MSLRNSHADPDFAAVCVTLPLEGFRSKIYSDKRAQASVTLATSGAKLVVAVAIVLARYETAESIILGVCRAGVAAAVSLSTPGDGTLASLDSHAASVLSAIDWDPASYERQVLSSGLSAVVDRNPLFGVLVVLDDASAPAIRQDVTLRLEGQGLAADYNTRLFKVETVERFLAHVSSVLAALAQTPSSKISDVRLLNDDEEADLLAFAAGGDPFFDGSVRDLLASALENATTYPAVEFGDRSWTLAELSERADEIAAALAMRICSKGSRIGIALRPGPDQVAALIAVIRLCGVIVPLDTSLPSARLAAIRTDAELAAIVTEDGLAWHFEDTDPIFLERLPPLAKAKGCLPDFGGSPPDDPLYLMFTSGSTGRPKGVLVPHRTLANLIVCEKQRGSENGRRTLGRTSIAFDVGLQELFATILFGGTLVIASDSERADVGALASLLARHRISRVYLPPVALHQMAESAGLNPVALGCLKEVVVAGEQLRISQALRRFFRSTPARLINQYGPTETHVATQSILDLAPLRWPNFPDIGRPLPGVRAYVINASGQLAPILVAGDLLIGGMAPALRYVGLPDLTQARFILDPTAKNSDAIAYRTGDRARWLSDGRLEFLGREDDQVKIRGYRVELGDLEANAERLPAVQHAAAKYWATETWTGLALYLVLRDRGVADLREMRDALKERVPEYMLPPLSAMMLIDKLPLSASGKVDRARLPYPDTSEPASTLATPADHVTAIWRRRIGIGSIDLDDDFVDLGGHSLLAIQIVSEVNDTFQIGVPLSTLLRGASLRKFTEVVERLLVARGADGLPSTQLAPGKPTVPEAFGVSSDTTVLFDLVDLPGGRFAVLSAAEARHLWTEICVERAYHHSAFHYRAGATIMDVGANVGIFSRYALQTTGGCRLIAIEPARELFSCLRQNLMNVGTQIDLLQLGCGAEDVDDASFWYFPQIPSMSSFAPERNRDQALLGSLLANNPAWSEGGDGFEQGRFLAAAFEPSLRNAPRRRISTIVRELQLENIDLLKIDVQRGEQDVLRGIEPSDWRKISQIVVELQDHEGCVENTMSILRSVGFTIDACAIPLHRGTNVKFVYGWRS